MPVTITYDFTGVDNNDRTYIRSMLERFHFRRLGGSVFRYHGVIDEKNDGELYEDWLNHIGPAIMFFRSYILAKKMSLKYLTIDASSVGHVDHSDPIDLYGEVPKLGNEIDFATPSNKQSSIETIREFLDASVRLTVKPEK